MSFDDLCNRLLEDFTAPVDTRRPVKVRPKGKYGTVNPQMNEPHSTKSISGFKGQSGGKMKTMFVTLPVRRKKKKSKTDSQ